MEPEFYHKNIFGDIVDLSLEETEEEVLVVDKKTGASFNIWSFTDAIGARDKKQAWILYEKALAFGMVPEELFYKLVWQVKCLLLAAKTKSPDEAELNPFVYRKAKSNLRNWKVEELEELSLKLVIGYHKARRGEGEIETLVEKTLLKF